MKNCGGGSRWKTAVVVVGSAEATSCSVNFMISGFTNYKFKYISLPLLRYFVHGCKKFRYFADSALTCGFPGIDWSIN